MADVTGTVRHEHDGKSYALRLTNLGLADLQDAWGADIGGLLSGKFDIPEDADESFRAAVPPMRLIVDVVARGLEKGEGMDRAAALDLADEMTTQDNTLMGRVFATAFPKAALGNAPAPKKAKR